MVEQPDLWGKTPPPPIVGSFDPANSHIGAALIEPSRNSKLGAVLAVLRNGDWHSGASLTEVGGSEGLRRVRELRKRGYFVEARPGKKGTGWEYRLGSG